jgi:hypothetical protein
VLALGITYRGDRSLVLVLPEEHAFATLQSSAWLIQRASPEIWLHGSSLRRAAIPSRDQTVKNLDSILAGKTPAADLRAATAPARMGQGTDAVRDLVEWATKHPLLDPGHRRSERSWHCMGQRVLSMRSVGHLP